MSLVDLRMTLEIILLVLNIAVLVKNNSIKPKKHKKTVVTLSKINNDNLVTI